MDYLKVQFLIRVKFAAAAKVNFPTWAGTGPCSRLGTLPDTWWVRWLCGLLGHQHPGRPWAQAESDWFGTRIGGRSKSRADRVFSWWSLAWSPFWAARTYWRPPPHRLSPKGKQWGAPPTFARKIQAIAFFSESGRIYLNWDGKYWSEIHTNCLEHRFCTNCALVDNTFLERQKSFGCRLPHPSVCASCSDFVIWKSAALAFWSAPKCVIDLQSHRQESYK